MTKQITKIMTYLAAIIFLVGYFSCVDKFFAPISSNSGGTIAFRYLSITILISTILLCLPRYSKSGSNKGVYMILSVSFFFNSFISCNAAMTNDPPIQLTDDSGVNKLLLAQDAAIKGPLITSLPYIVFFLVLSVSIFFVIKYSRSPE